MHDDGVFDAVLHARIVLVLFSTCFSDGSFGFWHSWAE
jgi:hypothetical protein